jgi:hypothetical protein
MWCIAAGRTWRACRDVTIRRRRLRRATWAGLIVVAAAAVAVAARTRIAEAVIPMVAAANGLPGLRLHVDSLGFGEAVLTDVSAGPAVSAARVAVAYDLTTPWRARIVRVTVEGTVVDIAAAAALADALPSSPGAARTTGSALPPIAVRGGVLRAQTPRGVLDLTVEGDLSASSDGGQDADFRLAADGRLGRLDGRLTGRWTGGPDGRATLAARLVKDAVERGHAEASIVVDTTSATVRATVATADAAVRGDFALSVGDLRGSSVVSVDATVRANAPAPLWRDLGLGELAGHAETTLRGAGLRPTAADGAVGVLQARIDLSEVATPAATSKRATVELPLRLRRDGAGYAARLAAPGRVEIAGLDARPVRLTQPVAIAIESADEDLLRIARDGTTAAAAQFAAGPITAVVAAAGGAPLTVVARPGPIHAAGDTAGRIAATMETGRLSLPAQGIEAGDVAFAFHDGDARLTIGALRLGEVPTPLAAVASVLRDGRQLALEAALSHPRFGKIAAATGRHDPASGRGTATVALGPLSFKPGALQPRDIAGALAAIDEVGGAASLDLDLAWRDGAIDGTGQVRLDDIWIAGGPVAVDGLTADVRLEALMPPRTPPGQTVTARAIGGAAGLRDARLGFALQPAPDGAMRIAVAGGGADFAGGRVTVQPADLVVGAPSNRLTIGFERVGLAPLFAMLDIDGIDGTGTADGSVPVEFADGAIAVRGGRLTAAPNGVLHIRSEAVNRALAGGGEPVRLMLQALEDFRYDRLSLDIDKAVGGEAKLLLSTVGHNPAVLDGHPFAINVTLSGNADRLLDALLEAYSVSDRALQQLLRSRR